MIVQLKPQDLNPHGSVFIPCGCYEEGQFQSCLYNMFEFSGLFIHCTAISCSLTLSVRLDLCGLSIFSTCDTSCTVHLLLPQATQCPLLPINHLTDCLSSQFFIYWCKCVEFETEALHFYIRSIVIYFFKLNVLSSPKKDMTVYRVQTGLYIE